MCTWVWSAKSKLQEQEFRVSEEIHQQNTESSSYRFSASHRKFAGRGEKKILENSLISLISKFFFLGDAAKQILGIIIFAHIRLKLEWILILLERITNKYITIPLSARRLLGKMWRRKKRAQKKMLRMMDSSCIAWVHKHHSIEGASIAPSSTCWQHTSPNIYIPICVVVPFHKEKIILLKLWDYSS